MIRFYKNHLRALLVVLTCGFVLVESDVVQIGKCPDLNVQADFDPELVSFRFSSFYQQSKEIFQYFRFQIFRENGSRLSVIL